MRYPPPFFRHDGSGEGVVCLHSNASSSGQWRPLMERLSPRFHVFAPDSLGAGKSPPWPEHEATLQDEVALLEPVIARAGSPFSLVGHSYGAAIALRIALSRPGDLRALVVYEPTLFSLLDEEAPDQEAANGIRRAAADAALFIDAGDPEAAAARFIDYWMGAGTWAAMPPARQDVVASSMSNVRRWAHALFEDPTPLLAFADLHVPVLYLLGGRSPSSTHGVARLLTGVLPDVSLVEFPELGHMGPATHPHLVNEAIARFLERS